MEDQRGNKDVCTQGCNWERNDATLVLVVQMVEGTDQQAFWRHEQIIHAIPKQGKCVCWWGAAFCIHIPRVWVCAYVGRCVCVRAYVRACVCQLLLGSALFLAFPFKLLSSHFPKKRSGHSGSPGTFRHIRYF